MANPVHRQPPLKSFALAASSHAAQPTSRVNIKVAWRATSKASLCNADFGNPDAVNSVPQSTVSNFALARVVAFKGHTGSVLAGESDVPVATPNTSVLNWSRRSTRVICAGSARKSLRMPRVFFPR